MSLSASHPAALSYLLSLEQWKGDKKFTIDGIRELLAYFGAPQDCVPCVHVAGTNGKGSVSAAVASILAQRGGRVVLTTSPHLASPVERICIDGYSISQQSLAEYAHDLRQGAECVGYTPSFFEGVTAIAFLVARDIGADWLVAEVGLGGRLDATNVISKPKVSAIVSIDFDHEDILGDSLAKIAYEKAGIIKSGCPVVCGAMDATASEVINSVARTLGARCRNFGVDFDVEGQRGDLVYRSKDGVSFDFNSPLVGQFQAHNMAVAVAAALEAGATVDECKAGLESMFWPGRLELVHGDKGRGIILDAAHNLAGMNELKRYLTAQSISGIELCFGALRTKHWKEMVVSIAPLVAKWILLRPRSSLAVPCEEVSEFLSSIGISSLNFGDQYLQVVEERVHSDCRELLVVAGSIYMMGEVRGMLNIPERPIWVNGR